MPYIIPKAGAPSPSSPVSSVRAPSSHARKLSGDDRPTRYPLKPALKVTRSYSSGDRPPFYEALNDPPFLREPRQRTKSAPVVAQCAAGPSSIPLPSPSAKSVRWPTDETSLERVRTFRKHGKPIHVSHPGDETGTETEGESSSTVTSYRYESLSGLGFSSNSHDRTCYPSTRFPKSPLSSLQTLVTNLPVLIPPLAKERVSANFGGAETQYYEVDETVSSPIPSRNFDPSSNVHLESLRCTATADAQTSLEGTVLVRNLSYSKDVTCRFTLDEWSTTSNVSAQYVETLPSFPLSFFPPQNHPTTIGDAAGLLSLVNQKGAEWDRFGFKLNVNHGAGSLSNRTLWLAVRFLTEGGEWWDNNDGQNYKVGFRLGEKRFSESPLAMVFEESGKDSKGPSKSTSNGRSPRTPSRQAPTSKENGSRRPSSPPISHTSHALLPIQPRGASPTPSFNSPYRYSAPTHSPLAYPTALPMSETKGRSTTEWKRDKWAAGNVQVSSIVSCRVYG